MKKFIFIALLLSIIFLVIGCLDNYVPIEEYNNEVALLENQLEKAKDIGNGKSVEILELKEEVENLEEDLDLTEEELIKYKNLLNNLNDLLSNVYYGYAENENWKSEGFTAFSLNYGDKIFLITAGHCVHYKDDKIDTGVYKYFKVRANFSNDWIYPKLLTYENDYTSGNDYAIFYSDKIKTGLNYDLKNTEPDYRLGINKLIQENNNWGEDGSCGSPVIDLDGEVIGIHIGYLTDIDLVLEAIDNLE